MNNSNPEQKLNPHLLEIGVEQIPIRNGYGQGLLLAGEENKNVVVLCADLTESTQSALFAEKYPARFLEMGVAEQNMAAVASGIAAMGKIPFISSYAMFNPGRNWEQIRTTICYNNANVKIAGAHAGVSVGPDGGTHQAIEDIAITRVIPRLTVISPCDAIEARKATVAAAKHKGPVYIRLAREKSPVIASDDSPFEIGKINALRSPAKATVAVFATGALVYQALIAADKLSKEGVEVSVSNIHTVKPLDAKVVIEQTRVAGAAVTVEEHQIAGGMGSAIAEILATNYPAPIEFLGIKDQFGQSGDPAELLEYYGLSVESIMAAVRKAASRKSR